MIRLFLLALPLTLVECLHLPSYIVPCSKRANFSACALDHAKTILPHILKGDRRLGLPTMDPLKITLVDLQGADNFHLAIKDINVYGLKTAELVDIDIDFDRQKGHVSSRVPQLEILGDYNMTGHLMIFPINGHGLVNITLLDGIYDYDFEWTLEKRHGDDYAKIGNNSAFDYKLGNSIYNFTNLMNGNERLSRELNIVLNENWRLVNEDLKESTKQTLLAIHNNLFSRVYNRIPFNELFLD